MMRWAKRKPPRYTHASETCAACRASLLACAVSKVDTDLVCCDRCDHWQEVGNA